MSQPVQRPVLVTVLAILAGIAGVASVIHALQGLGFLPYFIGPFKLRSFELWYALTWGLMAWIYFWLTRMLWRVERLAWVFMAAITVFNLVLDFATMLISASTFSDVSVSLLFNAFILIYIMLPGTRRAFEVEELVP